MKIAINTCFGGFSLSLAALHWLVRHSKKFADDCSTISEYFSGDHQVVKIEPHPELKDIWVYHTRWSDQFVYQDKVLSEYHYQRHERSDPDLIAVLETLGCEICSGRAAQLKIVDVPDDVDWEIQEYDGKEWVAEVHRCWS